MIRRSITLSLITVLLTAGAAGFVVNAHGPNTATSAPSTETMLHAPIKEVKAAWANAVEPLPTEGWSLHIDAIKHFPGDPEMVAHHYCKAVSGGLTECQIYDGHGADARLVAIEVIVDPATYSRFDPEEQKLWHYHKTEIPIVEATLPDLSPEEAAEVVKVVEETYGKVYLLWDPSQEEHPVGEPMVQIIGDPAAHAHPER